MGGLLRIPVRGGTEIPVGIELSFRLERNHGPHWGLSSNWTENRFKPGHSSHFFASFLAVNGANCGNSIAKGSKINSAPLGSSPI